MLSEVGSDVSSSLAGFILFGLFRGGVLLNFDTSGEPIHFTISAALLFGTICAAVDPVAVSAANYVLRQLLLLHTCAIHLLFTSLRTGEDCLRSVEKALYPSTTRP